MKTRRIVTGFLSVIIAALILFSFHSCSKSSSSTAGGNNGTIDITGLAFPSSTSVKMGTTVTWNNKSGITHTVTSDDGTSFNSGNLASGSSFSYTTTTAGSFNYHCNIHSNMHGTLIVTP